MATPERRRRVGYLLRSALALSPPEREGYLLDTCGDDVGLRREVESLLAEAIANGSPEPFPTDATTASRSETAEAPVRMWRHLEILEKVGEGGFAEVFRARDTTLHREVALKLVRPEARDRVNQDVVIHEGRLLASIKHPNVVTVYGADEHGGQLGMWMEFIRGKSLHAILRERGRFSAWESALVGVDVCRALAAIHANGIVHQDVKAQNVMRESGGRTVLMDLGVSVRSGSPSVGGTPRYRAPELGDGDVATMRSDIYSLGVLLYYLVTEKFPSVPRREDASLDAPGSSGSALRDVRPDLPEAFVRVVERALAIRPEKRFGTVGDMGKALLDFLEKSTPIHHGPSPRREPSPGPGKRAWPPAGGARALLAGALLAALVTGAWWTARRFRTAEPPPVALGGAAAALPVAVLLFQNRTGDPSLDWLRTGLAELMIVDLAQSPQLRVAPTDQVFQILRETDSLGEPITPPDVVQRVSERFAAKYVLLGAFFRAGSTFRLTVQIRASGSDQLVGTETAEGVGEGSLFSLVDRLSRGIKAALRLAPEQEELLDRELTTVTTASPTALRYYAEGLAMQYSGKVTECLPLYEKAVELDPNFALALSKLSLLHAQRGRDREAARLSERAAANLGRLSARERFYVEGNHYSNHESTYARAIEAYSQALSQYPDHWPARHNLAILFMDFERYADAVSAWQTNRRERPDMVPLYRYLAFCQAALGDFQAGYQTLQELRARHSREAHALVELGSYLAQWGRTAEALAAFDEAQAIPAARAEADEHVWATLVLREDWKGLEAWRGRISADDDRFKRARGALYQAVVLLYRGRSRDAVRLLADEAGASPEPGRATAAMRGLAAQVLVDSGQPGQALTFAAAARRDGRGDRGEWEGLYVASLAHAALGERERAHALAADLARQTSSVPTRKEERRHWHLLGNLARVAGDQRQALAHLGRAESLLPPKGIYLRYSHVPQHVPIWFSLGTTHLEAGDLDQAEAYFLKIVDSHSERVLWPIPYVRSLFSLASIHEMRGDGVKAREQWARFLDYWDGGDMDAQGVERARERLGRARAAAR